jgi:hypothetical protein
LAVFLLAVQAVREKFLDSELGIDSESVKFKDLVISFRNGIQTLRREKLFYDWSCIAWYDLEV